MNTNHTSEPLGITGVQAEWADQARVSEQGSVEALARRLVERLDVIHNDPHYQSVWTQYMIHGGDYSKGPKYDKELNALRAALSQRTTTEK